MPEYESASVPAETPVSDEDTALTEDLSLPGRAEACRAASRAFRSRRVAPSLVAAGSVVATAAVTVVEVISTRAGRPVLGAGTTRGAARLLRALTWQHPVTCGAAALLMLAGLTLLLFALLPGKGRTVPLTGDDPAYAVGLRRSSFRQVLAGVAREVPGVKGVDVQFSGRLRPRVLVRAVTGFRNPGNLCEQVAGAVREYVDDLDPVRTPRVVVYLTWRKD